jgi:hypothetical protein
MKRSVRLLLLLTIGLAACRPGLAVDSEPVEKLTEIPLELLTVTPQFLTELPSSPQGTPAPSLQPGQPMPSRPAPLRLELDPKMPASGDLRAYRLTVNIMAWEILEASRVLVHLPAGAAVREVSAPGWSCTQSLSQDDALPGEHLDMDCQALTTSRTPPAFVIVSFNLPVTNDPVLACAQVAIKDVFQAPLCVEATSQPQ